MKKIKQPETMVKWGHEDITMLELFKELDRCVGRPIRTSHDLEGDMYMSDYQKLSEAQWKISSTLQLLKGETND
jgi:hypothetical protein